MTLALGFFVGMSAVVWIGLIWKVYELQSRVASLEEESLLERRRRAYQSVDNVLPFRAS